MGHTVKEPHRVRLNLTMRKEAEAQGVEWPTPGPICTEGPASVSCLPLPPGLVQWQCPAPTDFSLSFINISHAWLRCFSSPPTATITPQSRADLPLPLLRIEELRYFHVFVNLKTEINWRGQTKKKISDHPGSPLSKSQHRVPSWPQMDKVAEIFFPFVSQWPSRKGNQLRVTGDWLFRFA